jgi:hypothetical protein
MSANYQQATRSPLRPVYRLRIKCPVCGSKDNCSVSEDRTRAYCRRTASNHQGRDGGWLHILEDTPHATSRASQQSLHKQAAPIIKADEARCHTVYTALLRELQLSRTDYVGLRARGLNDEAIEREQFRSTPTRNEADHAARRLAQDFDLTGVAGFYREHGTPRLVWTDTGIIIPARDQHARISALMYRRTHARKGEDFGKYIWISSAEDRAGKPREAGASSGAPSSYANSHLMKDAREVTIAEGILKSKVAAHLLNQPVIGNAPSCFGAEFAANLKRDFPRMRTVFVAFDMDFKQKPEVEAALFRLVEQLEIARFNVRVRMWPDKWKGIDDYLLAVASQKEVAA